MKYYVPVGPGGILFQIGMAVTGMMGSLVYWRASRRRIAAIPMQLPSAECQLGPIRGRPQAYGAIPAR
jgi:hypothetical protein